MLRIDLPRELENELTLLAALTGKSTQFHIRQAILEYLDDLDERIAAEKWLEDTLAQHEAQPIPAPKASRPSGRREVAGAHGAGLDESGSGGPDGTRTRDLRRDRPAF